MSAKDPFAGIRLSTQAQTGKLDQRLFAPPKPATPPPKPPLATPPPGAAPAAPAQGRSAAPKPRKSPQSAFDLDDEPLYKATFVFTTEELEALEDLKLELRRSYDRRVTKNDLIRAALHHLLEDHQEHQKASYATRKVIRSRG